MLIVNPDPGRALPGLGPHVLLPVLAGLVLQRLPGGRTRPGDGSGAVALHGALGDAQAGRQGLRAARQLPEQEPDPPLGGCRDRLGELGALGALQAVRDRPALLPPASGFGAYAVYVFVYVV
ncbi:hypothetical protein [Kitasatospora sp. NPDC057541]|uniref:hypothetical protein n=1 Tax=unclassified Kitasatospora TaxID=2633591 RepID=UPI0036842A39